MKTSIARRLLRLNREFYDRFATEFATSRVRLSPGMRRALGGLEGCRYLLDVGCGDGRVGRALASGAIPTTIRCYAGVDFSRRLLERGRRALGEHRGFELHEADLTRRAWSQQAALARGSFDAAVVFALLFHIPGRGRRRRLLEDVRRLLAPGGCAIVSVWQFAHVAEMRRKLVPWAELGLRTSDVDDGDLLVDWRAGGRGLRYVHHFRREELLALCRRAGFEVEGDYVTDGRTGDMSLYVLLRPGIG